MTLAIFHHHLPDGRIVATCANHPNWVCQANTVTESKRAAEASLLHHIEQTTTFSHYEIPPSNTPLRPVA